MPEGVSLKVLQENKIKSRQFLINCPKQVKLPALKGGAS
jgi:hypothetical protein